MSKGRTRRTKQLSEEEVFEMDQFIAKSNSGRKVSVDLLSQIKIEIKHKNETQKKLSQSIKNNDVTICSGPAGTGKSLVSMATALKLLQETDNSFEKLILFM